MSVRVCHLYPEHLNIYADRGNMAVLRRRCAWRALDFELLECGPGDPLPDADLYYLGGGQDRDQRLIETDLLGRAGDLTAAVADGASVLAVCGGYQMLGHAYRGHQGDELRGLGLVDLTTEAGATRLIGNITVRCELVPGEPRTLVGFENHAGRTHLGAGVEPLGRVLHGGGNNGEDGFEGVRSGGILGTYVHGPLLPKNPWLADHLIAMVLKRHGEPAELPPLDDALELEAHAVAERISASRRTG
jgi:CobQ-like glutamine amidotransferase family enzyme